MVLNCEFSQIILEISGREDIGIRKFEIAALKNHMRNPTNLACEKMNNNVFHKIGKTTFAKKKSRKGHFFRDTVFFAKFRKKLIFSHYFLQKRCE